MPLKDPIAAKAYQVEYARRRAAHKAAAAKAWRDSHPNLKEHQQAHNRKDYKKRKAAIDAKNHRYRVITLAADPDYFNRLARAVYARDPRSVLAAADIRRQRNLYHYRQLDVDASHRRRASFKGTVTPEEWLNVLSVYGSACLCCGRDDVPMTRDHIVPVSVGGPNTVDNLQPLCKSCNCKKRTKTIDYRPFPYQVAA